MRGFLAALRFLTVLPLPGNTGRSEEDLARSVPFLPVVGLLLGAVAAGVAWVLFARLPPLPAGVLTTIMLVGVSGGFHLDGLADTADGFLSSRPRDRILEIMKDSRTGAMGVTAIVCVLVLKAAALASIPAREIACAVLLVPIAGRCVMLASLALLPYARSEGGLGNVFFRSRAPWHGVWAALFLAAAGALAGGVAGLVAAGTALAAGAAFAGYCRYKIGGATGDTLGAACELAEVVAALSLAALPPWSLHPPL